MSEKNWYWPNTIPTRTESFDEEIAVLQADVKKAQEAKKAAILKKFDKDGDGKLSKEERKAMQEEWLKDHPEAAKRMEEMKARQEARKAEILKKYDKDGDGKLSDEEKKAMREDWAKTIRKLPSA